MKNGGQFAVGLLGFVLFLAGVVVIFQRLVGDSEVSLAAPCLLAGLGVGLGVLAWNFGSPVGDAPTCSDPSPRESEAKTDDDVGVDGEG